MLAGDLKPRAQTEQTLMLINDARPAATDQSRADTEQQARLPFTHESGGCDWPTLTLALAVIAGSSPWYVLHWE